MAEKTKQIRLRTTDEEKDNLEKAAADGGYANVSDYLRHILFDQHVLIVLGAADANGSLFRLVPAFSSVEAERDAALANLEGLLQLGMELQAQLEAAAQEPLLSSPEPADVADSQVPSASPVAPAEPVPAPAAPVPPPQAPVAAVPEPEPALGGPAPGPEETADDFMGRRLEELRATGLSPLRASLEAEAEWRASLGQVATVPPVLDAVPAPLPATPPMGAFCPNCGAGDAGGKFCTGCGSQLRQ